MRTIFSILSLFLLVQIGFSQPYPDSQTDGEYIEVNGAKLWTVRHGDGPPLFFIAGGRVVHTRVCEVLIPCPMSTPWSTLMPWDGASRIWPRR